MVFKWFKRIGRKTKYVLYCKENEEDKEWSPIAELDKPINLVEARLTYGEGCSRLRLEEVDAESGKRIKMVWVEPRPRKRRTPTLLDYMAELKLVSSAFAAVANTIKEIAKTVAPEAKGGGEEDLMKELLKMMLQARMQQAQLQMQQQPQAPPQVSRTTPQTPPPEVMEELAEAEERLLEHLEKDMKDIENAPCTEGVCVEEEEEGSEEGSEE